MTSRSLTLLVVAGAAAIAASPACAGVEAGATQKLYDSGAVGLSTEQVNDSSAALETQRTRAVHRAAYAAMVQVAEDLRRWLEAERLRERVL